MSVHPYKNLPNKSFWKRSVIMPRYEDVDPVGIFNIKLSQSARVATAGSCFSQHIARHLKNSGFNYFVAEPGHPIIPQAIRDKHNYGVFSARYGNIYTARQLLQLFRRAYNQFSPSELIWTEEDGTVRDPFRPTVQPGGFISAEEMLADRKHHLACVRDMFESLDVFVFTLGMTECWISRIDGAVFPVAPGIEGGTYDPDIHQLHCQDVMEVITDMTGFIEALQVVNTNARVILTVSPVPLIATAVPEEHVLTATTYSKSVLRVAAESLRSRYSHVHYFPSYEIITGSYNRGRYFAQDLRNVTEEGVQHVMRMFLKHMSEDTIDITTDTREISAVPDNDFIKNMDEYIEVECDESAIERHID